MKNADLDYFCEKELYRQEKVISSVDCLHEGNPFVGTLILTDHRLSFVRKAMPGFEVLNIKSSVIVGVNQRIARGLDFILQVAREKFVHEFELRGVDTASKQAFVDLIKKQFDLLDIAPSTQPKSSTHN